MNNIHQVIYMIKCKDPTVNHSYVGSTSNFKIRIMNHRNTCNNPNSKNYNNKKYNIIRENGGIENWLFIPLEYLPNANKQELLNKEKYYYNVLKPSMNKNSVFLTREEYMEKRRQSYKDTFYCELCNCNGLKSHKARHNKTKRHIKKLQNNNNNLI